MKTRAAVAWKAGAPLSIETVDLEGPKAGEVLVEVKATGICHTDQYTLSGADPEGLFPAILGHEQEGFKDRIARMQLQFVLRQRAQRLAQHRHVRRGAHRVCLGDCCAGSWLLVLRSRLPKNLKLSQLALMAADFKAFISDIFVSLSVYCNCGNRGFWNHKR